MEGLKRSKKSVGKEDLVEYVKWTKEFGVEWLFEFSLPEKQIYFLVDKN